VLPRCHSLGARLHQENCPSSISCNGHKMISHFGGEGDRPPRVVTTSPCFSRTAKTASRPAASRRPPSARCPSVPSQNGVRPENVELSWTCKSRDSRYMRTVQGSLASLRMQGSTFLGLVFNRRPIELKRSLTEVRRGLPRMIALGGPHEECYHLSSL
jgi:hypothetical protein